MRKIALLGLLFLFGCGENPQEYRMPDFPETVRGEVELLGEDLPYYYVHELYVYDSYLVVAGIPRRQGVHIYDRYSGALLKSVVKLGRGPNEIGGIDGVSLDAVTGDMFLIDRGLSHSLRLNVNDVVANEIPRLEKDAHEFGPVNWIEAVYQLDDDKLLLRSATSPVTKIFPRERLEMYDGVSKIWSSNDFPIQDMVGILNYKNGVETSGALSKDRKWFFLGTGHNGATLECFEVASDRLVPRWTKYLIEPCYDWATGEEPQNRIRGFMDVSVSEDLLLTVIGDDRQHWVRSVCEFDFEGNPVKRIVIDSDEYNILKVCMNEQGEMYAVVITNKYDFYLARIREAGPTEYVIPQERIDHFTPEAVKNPASFDK